MSDLAGRLRAETRLLHTQVEGSAFIVRLVAGRLDRAGYCLLLRNLHPIYRALEAGAARLEASRPAGGAPAFASLFHAELLRLGPLESDLRVLHGPRWRNELPVLSAARVYERHLDAIRPPQEHLLAAHAYVRYLGDLAGGQRLRGIVAQSLDLRGEQGTAFYQFGEPGDVPRLVKAFRAALNACTDGAGEAIVAEAKLAFAMHQTLFDELDAASPCAAEAQGLDP